MKVKKQQLDLDMEQQTGSKLGKEYVKAVYCHPAYLQDLQNLRKSKHPAESTFSYLYLRTAAAAKSLQSCPTLCNPIDGSPPGFPRPWDSPGKNTGVGCHFLLQCMKVKSESKVAQSCVTLRDPMDCSFPGSSVHGIFQARVVEWGAFFMTKLDSILKSRDNTLPTKVRLVKAMVFPVVMYGCEIWTIKKAEC